MNVKEFLNLDSLNIDKDGNAISHEEKYTRIVNAIGLEKCVHYLPETKENLKLALEEDEFLNNIPLQKWDFAFSDFRFEFYEIGINVISKSDSVCTLKQCARMYVNNTNGVNL